MQKVDRSVCSRHKWRTLHSGVIMVNASGPYIMNGFRLELELCVLLRLRVINHLHILLLVMVYYGFNVLHKYVVPDLEVQLETEYMPMFSGTFFMRRTSTHTAISLKLS